MKNIVLSILICFIVSAVDAQSAPDSDKQLLFQILKERQEKFSAYTKSLDESSGIFGMKTKKDLKNSNAILIEIVKLDNRLIAVLNRQLNYKDYEKTTMNYQGLDDQKKLDLLEQNIQFSENKIKELNAKLLEDQQQIKNRNRLIVVLILILSALFYLIKIRKKKE